MVFLVAGGYLGYWIFTGRAGNFLYAIKNGQTQPQQSPAQQTTPPAQQLIPQLGTGAGTLNLGSGSSGTMSPLLSPNPQAGPPPGVL